MAVEELALAFSGLGFKSAKGRLSLWIPVPTLLIVRMTGQGDKSFAEPIVRGFEESLQSGSQVEIFFDLELMATYDSELRTALTAAFLRRRERISGLHVLVGSKLTAMGVSVANLALGGIITTHSQRPPFASALDAALAAARVKGFSSDALCATEPARGSG
jgi:hypothetical protein